jgi:DNA-binding beta-propeller fold protein YncE
VDEESRVTKPMNRSTGTTRFVTMLVVIAGSLIAPATALAQTCTSGGTSGVAPVVSAALRSYGDYFGAPGRLAVDRAGSLYTTDPERGAVYIRDRYGRLMAIEQGFGRPLGIAVNPRGQIYVAEVDRGSVTVFDQQWRRLYSLGIGDGEFQLPNDISIAPDTGQIYVADSAADAVKVYTRDGVLKSIFGGRGQAAGQFDFPAAVHVSALGDVFVADQNNGRVQVFDVDGRFRRCFGGDGSTLRFVRAQGLAGDSLGRVYVADSFQGEVQVFDPSGVQLGAIGGFGSLPGQLRTPIGLAIDPYSRLFVASANNARVEVFGVGPYSDPHLVTAVVDVEPKTVSRTARRPRSITARIQIRGVAPSDIDVTTVTANAAPAIRSSAVIEDQSQSSIPALSVKFDIASMLATLPDGEAVVVVSGTFKDGIAFEGYDTIRVVERRYERNADADDGTEDGRESGADR